MIKLSQDSIVKLLNERNLQPIYQKENDQTYIVMNIKSQEVPVFFGIRSNNSLLQMIAYIPFELHQKTLTEVCRLFHILNREVDMPGFGVDEIEMLMFYRLVIPCVNGEFDERLLNLSLATTKVAIETFIGVITMVLAGQVTVDHFLKEKK